jgi:hypothetical protein
MNFLKRFISSGGPQGNARNSGEEVNVGGEGFGGEAQQPPETSNIENPDEAIVEIQDIAGDINPTIGKKENGTDDNDRENSLEKSSHANVKGEIQNNGPDVDNGLPADTARSRNSFTSFQPEQSDDKGSGANPSVAGTERNRRRDSKDSRRPESQSKKTARSSAEETPREGTETTENAQDDDSDAVEIKFEAVACGFAHTVVITDSGFQHALGSTPHHSIPFHPHASLLTHGTPHLLRIRPGLRESQARRAGSVPPPAPASPPAFPVLLLRGADHPRDCLPSLTRDAWGGGGVWLGRGGEAGPQRGGGHVRPVRGPLRRGRVL